MLIDFIRAGLQGSRREPDGLLHASSHLASNLRHTLLSFSPNLPPIPEGDIVSGIRMMTGTLWHSQVERYLSGQPVMLEVDVTPWMPTGWSGRVDYLIWDAERGGFMLKDLKTIKGEGVPWIRRDGAKIQHVWQTSAYWWACYEMGLPMIDEISVLYLPMNVTPDAEPLEISFPPLSLDVVMKEMHRRSSVLYEFAEETEYSLTFLDKAKILGPGRVQRCYWNKQQGVFDVKLVPHWEANYCVYPEPFCDCATLKTTKIGHYTKSGIYLPRNGYEDIEPEVTP